MFGKIVIVEESDLEFNSSLKMADVGAFAVLWQDRLIVCRSLSHASEVLYNLEN